MFTLLLEQVSSAKILHLTSSRRVNVQGKIEQLACNNQILELLLPACKPAKFSYFIYSCDIPLDLSNYWVPQMYVKKQRDGKFYFLDNYMAIYYKLLNERGGVHPVNNPINQGDFHSFPPGFR